MRAPLAKENKVEIKTPSKDKSGQLIKFPIKKTYCSKCQKLVKGIAQISGTSTRINCPRCSQNLWVWSHISWRAGKSEAGSSL
jgi:hypothetical protein